MAVSDTFMQAFDTFEEVAPFIRIAIMIVIFFIIFNILLGLIKSKLLKKAKTKQQIANVEIFTRIFKYFSFAILILGIIFSYTGSWTGFGVTLGLLSAALGFALQKPLAGLVAWMIIITTKPFEIGDRIVIGDNKFRGDVEAITLTHIHLNELGGLTPAEDQSGRKLMVPNFSIFEQNVVNYTAEDEFILSEVSTNVTYEGDLDKAIDISLESARDATKEFSKIPKEPYVRLNFGANGVDVIVRFFCPARRVNGTKTRVVKGIYDRVKQVPDVDFAYPHTEFLIKKNPENPAEFIKSQGFRKKIIKKIIKKKNQKEKP